MSYTVSHGEWCSLPWGAQLTRWPLQTTSSAGRRQPVIGTKCALNQTVSHTRQHFHNSVLSYIALSLKENLPQNITIYANLDEHKCNGLTIPQNIVVTSSRPDLVIIDNSPPTPTIYLLELTIYFEWLGNMEVANKKKYERYSALTADIQEARYNCKNIPFEIGSRGHLTLENKSILTIMQKLCKPNTSLLCSYSVYLSRHDTWTGCPLLSPVRQ